jgi:NADH-quinone oxidoreductase subunit L
MLDLLWLIPLLCLAGALANLVLGVVRAPKAVVTAVGVGSVGAATGLAYYSVGYMHGESDAGYARYFAYLNLFMFAMLCWCSAPTSCVLFVGWEGVGLCSYLLIGFYFQKRRCAAAGKKAFIVNRIGDFGFLLGDLRSSSVFGTPSSNACSAPRRPTRRVSPPPTVIALLLFVGAIGKSAQVPLYVWLPDAMAGPTPVSALIHAATMVTAGVYMVARANPVRRLSPTAMLVVAVVGGFTAIFAATIGLVQNDIKKVLAYSTVSQLGFMFLAAGVGAFVAAVFHVLTHAFFKACLFLGSGSVIHALGGEQDMRAMGGLRKPHADHLLDLPRGDPRHRRDPAAFPASSPRTRSSANYNGFGTAYTVLWALGLAAALLTAFYMFRALYLTFRGEYRGGAEKEEHVHESPRSMTLPLIVLGVLSAVGGFVGLPGQLLHLPGINLIEGFLAPVIPPLGAAAGHAGGAAHAAHGLSTAVEGLLMLGSVAAAVIGILVARRFYLGPGAFTAPQRLAARLPMVHKLLLNRYWVDEIYAALVVRPVHRLGVVSWRLVDELLIDTCLVNGPAFTVELAGDLLRFSTTGNVRNYALAVAAAVVGLAALLW